VFAQAGQKPGCFLIRKDPLAKRRRVCR
jgi:hypothetical protein